ncbi:MULTISPECIES: zinc-ribbon domain-containing protein [unclassified Streptomyces]|uniref:zinc-ribbon domain-containing protein n=1 Tax=unclassified Streptomyces TaxID=2593676 RepID=UPI000B848911|nr:MULTISPECIES: zinc-ribbon domain-containing protein [unclassified Streptomyces]MYS24094.1 zinc-ribbon domain-containing protein [Streptomyces sp. SID4948]
MLIFGTRRYLHQLAMLTLLCAGCGNPAAHALRKRVVKFTLFFVPLFPVSTTYSTQCTFCGVQHKLPKEQAEQLLAQIGAQGAAPQGSAPQTVPQPQEQNPQQG